MSKSPKPKGTKNGKHRRAGKKAHSDSIDGAGDGTGGTISITTTAIPFIPFDNPEPKSIPYAGIRTGEVIGRRLWWVVKEKGEDWICSLAHRRLWKPGETIYGDVYKLVLNCPSIDIYGGTFSFSSQASLNAEIAVQERNIIYVKEMEERYGSEALLSRFCLEETRTFVSGKIKMWGDIVEHETGYRAEYAKLVSLDEVYGNGCDLEKLRAKYLS
jgi:hypothetical protein